MNFHCTALIVISLLGLAHAYKSTVTFFIHPEFQGSHQSAKLTKGECYAIPYQFDDKISSMNTWDSCIILYKDVDCTGDNFSLYPGTPCHDRFLDCNMEDVISSIKLCE